MLQQEFQVRLGKIFRAEGLQHCVIVLSAIQLVQQILLVIGCRHVKGGCVQAIAVCLLGSSWTTGFGRWRRS